MNIYVSPEIEKTATHRTKFRPNRSQQGGRKGNYHRRRASIVRTAKREEWDRA